MIALYASLILLNSQVTTILSHLSGKGPRIGAVKQEEKFVTIPIVTL